MADVVEVAADAAGYEQDFHAWTVAQAAALRAAAIAGANLPVDWENVAEEIESLGRAEVSAIRSRIATIIEHLAKLEFSPAIPPGSGWRATVRRSRADVERRLAASPSLRRHMADWVTAEFDTALATARDSLDEYGELDHTLAQSIGVRRYTPDEVLGEWFPSRRSAR